MITAFVLSSAGLVLLCCRYRSVSARRELTSSEEPDTLTCTLRSPTAAAPTCVHRSSDQTEHFICQNARLPERKCAVMRYDSAKFGMKLIIHEERRVVHPCEWISSYSLTCVALSCGFCLPCRPSLMSSEMFLMF